MRHIYTTHKAHDLKQDTVNMYRILRRISRAVSLDGMMVTHIKEVYMDCYNTRCRDWRIQWVKCTALWTPLNPQDKKSGKAGVQCGLCNIPALFSPVTSAELTEYPGSDLRCIALLCKFRLNKRLTHLPAVI